MHVKKQNCGGTAEPDAERAYFNVKLTEIK